MDFLNKVVVITGAASGIGEATAINFAKLSANLSLFDKNKETLLSVSNCCEELSNNKVKQFTVNVSVDEEIRNAVNDTLTEFGKIDVVVNCAGFFAFGNILDANILDIYDDAMHINFRSIVCLTNLVVPSLIQTKGNIINISSTAAVKPSSIWSPYCVSKAALCHFTKCLALELAKKGVRVNAILPGPVKSQLAINSHLVSEENNERFWDNLGKTTPLGHYIEPTEIADLIVYLASEKAKNITGVEYVIDCGIALAEGDKLKFK